MKKKNPTEEEMGGRIKRAVQEFHESGYDTPASHSIARQAINWSRQRDFPVIFPCPFSDRLPEQEDCTTWADYPDSDPWFWAVKEIDGQWEWTQQSIELSDENYDRVSTIYGNTHWLPYYAIPLPLQSSTIP